MTTGATGQLGLALPVQGELSGTWGDTVNNGITQYTNIAIAGTLTLTNDGAVTLANTTGDASASNITSSLTGAGTVTAQFAIVKVTGTLTTAKVVTGPSYSKTYTVVNSATGGIVTFKASGQTGVSIAVGETAFVYYNGTDYVKVVGTATAGAAGGSNTQVQFNSSGVLAGDADLTFDGTTLSTAGLTASGTVTLSGGTANGVAYLNGSKVVTSGSALTFDGTNLGVGGGTTAYNNAKLTVVTTAVSGRQTLSSIDKTTANWVRFTNPEFSTNASMGLILKSFPDSDSRQGAGIIASGGATNNSTNLSLFVSNSAATAFAAYTATPDGTDVIHTWNSAASSEAMRLTSTGLGIGTSSPSYKLDVRGTNDQYIQILTSSTGGYAAGLRMKSTGSGEYGVFADSSLRFYDFTASATRATIDSSGNLGLGVTPSAWSSSYKAISIGFAGGGQFAGGTANTQTLLSTNLVFTGTGATGWKLPNNVAGTNYEQYLGAHKWYNAPANGVDGDATLTQAMTLDASGRLAIGTTSINSTLVVRGDNGSSSNAIVRMRDTNSTARTTRLQFEDYAGTLADGLIDFRVPTAGDGSSAILQLGVNSAAMTINASGNVGIGTSLPETKLQVSGNAYIGVSTSGGVGAQTGLTVVGGATVSSTDPGIITISSHSNARSVGDDIGRLNFYSNDASGGASGIQASVRAVTSGSVGEFGNLTFFTGSAASLAERARITSDGNMGIGTTSPSATDFNASSTVVQVKKNDSNGGLFKASSSSVDFVFSAGDGLAYIATTTNTPITFLTNSTERARILSNGVLLVGTSSVYNSDSTTQISGNPSSNQVLSARHTGASPNGLYILYSGASPNNTGNYFGLFVDNTAIRFELRSNGGIANYQANDANLSDRREKTNFAPAGSYLDKICAIPVQTFNYIDQNMEEDGGLTLGVVAQDVQAVAPELVMESNWAKKDEAPKMRLSIYQTDLQYALMKCIQEQQAIIESLKARLDAANL
jgi:hypothetical protein